MDIENIFKVRMENSKRYAKLFDAMTFEEREVFIQKAINKTYGKVPNIYRNLCSYASHHRDPLNTDYFDEDKSSLLLFRMGNFLFRYYTNGKCVIEPYDEKEAIVTYYKKLLEKASKLNVAYLNPTRLYEVYDAVNSEKKRLEEIMDDKYIEMSRQKK